MLPSVLSALTTGEWIVAVGSGVVLLLSLVPVVWLSWRFVQMSDDEFTETVADVERFAARRDSARKAMWR
jgi:type IV secretory pathway VirB3-like protein